MNSFVHTFVTGFCMGAADVVPGISGGTVALLCGIYRRLLTAIGRFDLSAMGLLRRGRFGELAQHLDLGFVVTLLSGLACGFSLSLVTVKRLLENDATRPATLSVFAGLILASAWLLARTLTPTNSKERTQLWSSLIVGIVVAAAICLLPNLSAADQPSLWFVFVCGAIGICAMILPGISGAMILLMIGIYPYLVGLPHRALEGNWREEIPVLLVFAAGCAIGLLSFSRLLSWALETYRLPTTSTLVGLMIGSLVRLWPFQVADSVTAAGSEHVEPVVRWVLPEWNQSVTWWCLLGFIIGNVVILVIQAIAAAAAKRARAAESEG